MNSIRTGSAFIALAILTAAPLNAAILTGSVAPPPGSVNLTTEGNLDWIHWGLSAATDVNREDFGITWNVALETGGLLVGKTVRIELAVQAIAAGKAAAA